MVARVAEPGVRGAQQAHKRLCLCLAPLDVRIYSRGVTVPDTDRVLAFLCHASEDKPAVRELYRRLQADGIDVWMDEADLLPGQDWEDEIRRAVRQANVVLVCLSARSVSKSGFVQREIRHVLDVADEQPEGRIFVIPVRLEECDIPGRLRRWQWADLYNPDGYTRLLQTLQGQGGASEQIVPAASVASPRHQPSTALSSRARRRRIAVMVALAAVSLVLAALALTRLQRVMQSGPLVPPDSVPEGKPADAAGPHTPPPGMVFIPAGTFVMGRDDSDDPDEAPAHSVTLPAFFIDATVASDPATGQPLTSVTWEEAKSACEARAARLPSEAEWEYAARGTDGRRYPWGNEFDSALANSLEAGLGHVEPVRSRPRAASPFGVLDMAGNVWQWCSTMYERYDGRAHPDVPVDARVIRGGSFRSDRRHVTTTTRNYERPDRRSEAIGYRCVRSIVP